MKKLLFLFLASFIYISLSGQDATIKEEMITFPTYDFGDPDPVARPGKIFPYFRFDGFSYTPVNKPQKMVVLENKWIKVWVAPEIGGKIWGALDKKNNEYFIYFNKVVKFRDIAMRGPWTSGGIEHNFGIIGHAPTVATPVDYHYQKNTDGSVSCFVGSLDLSSRTEWRVEIRLPNDKAWFEVISYWNNPTDKKTALYHWQTAAANGTDDLQFIFPGSAEIAHDGECSSWPVDEEGRDLSYYINNKFGSSKSYHVLGEYADWFAGYYHDSKSGFGHWARLPVKPGKKIFLWSLGRDGAIWHDLLTDPERGNAQYIEMQTGLLFNQEGDGSTMTPFKHRYFEPGGVENVTELWFPISDIKGVNSISREGILNVIKNDKDYTIQFQALSFVNDKLQITDLSGNVIEEFNIDLEPEQIFTKSVSLKDEQVKFRLAAGELKYDMSDKEANFLDRPLEISPDFDWESVYGLYTRGIEKARQRSYPEAVTFLNKCLEKDPSYYPALTSLAEIDYHYMNYEEAEKKIRKVISFDVYDPDANFLYGVLLTRKKEYNNARDAFGVTLRTPQYKSVSRNKLALIALNENRLDEAWEYVNEALLYNGMDKNVYRTAAATARLRGDKQSHEKLTGSMMKMDPLNHFAAFEKYYAGKEEDAKKLLESRITGEFRYETFIELALWYMNAGLLNEAASVMELCPENPLADYLSSYLAFKQNDSRKSQMYLERALKADDKLVFPYREEYAEILAWADKQQPSWKTKYYSALLYWNKRQFDVAKKLFTECGDEPKSYSFYLSRGRFLEEGGKTSGEPDYLKALNYGSDNWRPYHILYGYYIAQNRFDKALEMTQRAVKMFDNVYVINFDHAMSLLYNNKYEESVKILEKIRILPHEGAGYGRMAWKNANLFNALKYYSANSLKRAAVYTSNAYKWPENLGVGRPFNVDERAEDFISALILEKSGKKKEASAMFEKVAGYNSGKPSNNRSINYLSVLALNRMGKNNEADVYFNNWMSIRGNDKIKEWARLMKENRKEEAAGVLKGVVDTSEGTPWNPVATDVDFKLVEEIAKKLNYK